MKRIVIADSVANLLFEAADAVQICTPSGQIVGYFTPAADPNVYDETEVPCSMEELRDRIREGGGRPLADILRDLEKRS